MQFSHMNLFCCDLAKNLISRFFENGYFYIIVISAMYRKFLRTQICMKTLGFCENANGKKPNITNLQMIIWQKALYHYFGCLYGKKPYIHGEILHKVFCHKKIELHFDIRFFDN